MEKFLELYKYIDGVNDAPFPDIEEHLVIREFRYDAKRMGGAPTISFTAMHRLCLDNMWSKDVYATFNGERYYIKQTPTSSYSNSDTRYKHEVELISERSVLDNVYFYDVVTSTSVDKPVSNSSKFTFFGDVHEYVTRLDYSLKWANVDYTIVVDEGITSEEKQVTFEDQVVTNALQEIYNIYQIPYYFVGKVIHVGEYQDNIDHVFKYGANNSLLSISKNNANAKIVNRITGVGSQDNIPYYYPNDDEKGVTIPLLNGSKNGVSISNQSRYRKVRLSDKFVFHRSIQTQTPLIDSSIYTLGDLTFDKKEEGKDAQYSVDFYYTFSLDQGEKALFNVSTEDESTVDLRYEIYKTSGNHLGYFSGDNTISLTGGTYNLIVRWAFLNPNVMFGVEEQLESLIRSKLNIAAYIIVNEEQTWTLKNIPVNLYSYGLSVYNPVDGDVITIKQESYINPQPFLMPYVYRKQGGNERFYNAENNTYIDENGEYYVFENEYSKNHPSEHIENFDDIKPTIKNVTNAEGFRIDRFIDFAYDTYDNDEVDEEGKFIHKYFFAKLNKLDGKNGFNLFDHAIDDSEMVISMTSGSCGSCSFKVMVNKDTQKNTVQVDEYGNLLRDSNGNVRFGSPQDRQNDTEKYEVWIALEKDIDTFGVLMPNATNKYRPLAGDTFVILHIDLPKAYIEAAEKRLDEKLIKYMYDNNFEKFNFSIAFSRIFFAENPSILNSLNENSKITIEYNGREYSLYASSISIAMTNEQPLPEIKVELNDNIAVSQNQISQIVDATKKDILSKTTKDVFWGDIKGVPSWIGSEKPRYSYSELSGRSAVNDSNGVWVIKKDDNGNEYVYTNLDIVTQKGLSMYHDTSNLDLPSIYDGLPLDNDTIYWEEIKDEEGNVIGKRIKARGGSGEGGITPTLLGDLTNVGAWANAVATEDRIMVQRKDSASWVALNLSEIGGGTADFSNVDERGYGNAFTSFELSNDKKTLTLVKGKTFATKSDIDSRVNALVNGAPAAYDTLKEIADVLQGNVNSIGDIVTALGGKANKATTLAGYGITDAKISNGVITLGGNSITPLTSHQTIYNLTLQAGTFSAATFDPNGGAKTVYIPTTTSHVSEGSNLYFTNARAISALSDTLKAYVTLSGTQTITGEKDFTGGLKVNGSPIVYDKTKKYWKFEGDLLVTGGITMYGLDGSSFGTIWDNAPIATTSSKGIASFDPNFFAVNNGKVTFIGQTGGGSADVNELDKRYVKLSGAQTISGEKTFESSIKIKRGFSILDDQGWGIVGVNSTGWTGLPEDGSAIGFGTGAAPVYIRTSGDDLYHYNKTKNVSYKIIDSNNIANYKVGDSIKFNGFSMRTDSAFENKAVDANINYVIDATSLSTSYFYPVIFPCSLKDLYVRMYSTSGTADVAYNQNKLEFTFRGQGWMDAPNGLTVHFYSCYDAKETTIGCIAMGEAQGYKVVWVRGGLTYYVTSNITPTLYKDGVTFINEKYSYGVNFYGGTNTNVKVYWTPQATSGLGAMYHSGSIGTYGSLNVKGISIYKSDKGYLFIDGDLVVKGGITMYGTDGTVAPTIWDGAPKATTSDIPNGKGIASFDSKFFSVSNGHVTFIGDVGGLDESALASYLSTNKYLTQTTGDARYLAIGGNAVSAGMVKGNIVSNGNSATNTNKAMVYYSEIPSTATNIPTSSGYQNSILSLGLHSNGATAQLFFSASQSLYYRPNVSTNWNEIAYTTSNVASATTASKLSTVSKTAWGQTYWTSGGVPTSISGDMTGVGSISMNGTLTGATSLKINVPITYLSNFKLGSLGTSSNIAIHHSNQFGVYGMVDYNSGAFALQAAYQTTTTALDILLQPRGGKVAIGKTSATCALDVNGEIKGNSGSFSGNVSMGGATVNGNLNLGASGLLFDSNNSYGNSSWLIFAYGPTLQFKYGNKGSTPSTMGLQISKADGSITTYGEIKHPNATKFSIANTSGTYKGIMSMDAANNFCLGYDSSASSYDTYIDGFNMHFRTGNVHSEIFTLGSAGNAKLYLKTAALIIKRNHSSGGAYTQYQPCNQENRSWSAGVNNSYQYSWWYQNVSSGIDVQKMYLDSSGNLLTTGGITMYSDLRKKTILNHVELSLKEVAEAPLIEHYYNSDEAKTTHVGSVAQYWAGLNDWFCKEDGEGFLTMEIQNAALASAISVARELTRYESKTDKQIKKLKKRIGELEEEIENLKNK